MEQSYAEANAKKKVTGASVATTSASSISMRKIFLRRSPP